MLLDRPKETLTPEDAAAKLKKKQQYARDEKRSASAAKSYAKEVAKEESRQRARWLMYALQDFVDGKDTEEAREVSMLLGSLNAEKARLARIGDHTNQLPQHKRLAEKEEKERRKRGKVEPATEADRTKNKRKEVVVDGFGNATPVESRSSVMRGRQAHQIRAAERFSKDWEMAYGGGLKAASFEMKVDGGAASTRAHLARRQAQDRLQRLKSQIGEEAYEIAKAAAVFGIGPAAIHKAGGPQHVIASDRIGRALTSVAGFYDSRQAAPDPMLRAVTALIEEAERTQV
jgi:hypothetical protein